MKKVCFLLSGFTGGGIGRVVSILTNKFIENENYRIYFALYCKKHKRDIYNFSDDVQCQYLLDRFANMKKALFKAAIRLRKYIKNNEIDVLIACGSFYYPLAVLANIGLKTKLLCWEHSNVQNNKDYSFQSLSRYIGAKQCDNIVAITKYDKKSFKHKYRINNVSQIYNPVDPTIYNCVKDYDVNSKKILSVGRLTYQKNYEALIEVADIVLKKYPDWIWDIYGEGELREQLQNIIDDKKLTKRLILKGNVNNLYSLYNQYAAIIMTSRYEGFPMVLLEASANKLPLISFDVLTGPNEIIKHGSNGFLIEPFNINQMIECIEIIICNKDLRCKMSQNSYKTSDRFDVNAIVYEWTKLI